MQVEQILTFCGWFACGKPGENPGVQFLKTVGGDMKRTVIGACSRAYNYPGLHTQSVIAIGWLNHQSGGLRKLIECLPKRDILPIKIEKLVFLEREAVQS